MNAKEKLLQVSLEATFDEEAIKVLLKQLFPQYLYQVFIEFADSEPSKSEVLRKILDVYSKTHEIENEIKTLNMQAMFQTCFQKSADKFKPLVGKFNTILPIINNQSCFDLLIQSPNNSYDAALLKQLFELDDHHVENRTINHKSFVSLCHRRDINVGILERILQKFSFVKGPNETNKNSSLSVLFERKIPKEKLSSPNQLEYFFNMEFIKKFFCKDSKFKSFLNYRLEHTAFEALCERKNLKLMEFVLDKSGVNFSNNEKIDFELCFIHAS